jgi:hypothetical protein
MRNGTSYEVQVRLADQTTALLTEGVLLRPTEFELRAELQNATAVSGQLVRSRARGGGGYVCCGAVKSFVMPHVPETHALAVEFNLTGGMVRALVGGQSAHGGACVYSWGWGVYGQLGHGDVVSRLESLSIACEPFGVPFDCMRAVWSPFRLHASAHHGATLFPTGEPFGAAPRRGALRIPN